MRIELKVKVAKKILKEKGWSMAELARQMGISYVSVYRHLNPERMGEQNRRSVSQEMVAKFLTALECSFEDIFEIVKEG